MPTNGQTDVANSHFSQLRKSALLPPPPKERKLENILFMQNRAVGQVDEPYFESLARSCL
jgi:hypothetical protein